MHILQETLENFFPSWESVEKHQAVVKYACGLMKGNTVLVEILCKRRAEFIVQGDKFPPDVCKYFAIPPIFESVAAELPEGYPMSPKNNEIISYTTFENPLAHIPSNLHVIRSHNPDTPHAPLKKENITFNESSASKEPSVSSSKWGLGVRRDNQLLHDLQLIRDVEQRQQQQVLVHGVNIHYGSCKKENKGLDRFITPETELKLSQNAAFVRLQCGMLSQSGCKKLQECSQLKSLDLYLCDFVPKQLAETIGTMMSLVNLTVTKHDAESRENSDIGRALAAGIASFSELEDLYISGISMKSCLGSIFPHEGFRCLKLLEIETADLDEDDLLNLSEVFHNKQLPVLEDLSLEGNRLTKCLSSLVLDGHPEFPCLRVLNLSDTELSVSDLTALSHAVEHGTFPKLKEFYCRKMKWKGIEKSLIKFLEVCKSFYKGQNIQIEISKADVEGKLYKQLQEIQDESLRIHFTHSVYCLQKAQFS